MFDHALPPSLPARLLSAASLRQRGVEKTAMNGPQRELRASEPERRDIGSGSEPCRSGLRSRPGCCNHQTERRGSKGKTVDQPRTENHIYQEDFEALEAIWTCSAFIHTGPRHIVMLHDLRPDIRPRSMNCQDCKTQNWGCVSGGGHIRMNDSRSLT